MEEETRTSGSFLSELKRRQVISTCVWYVLLVWGVLQVGDILFPAIGLDGDATSRILLYVGIAGFPVTFALAWFFQFTTHGIVRTQSFVERRVLSNVPPINERRRAGMSAYFRKDQEAEHFQWIIAAETGPLSGLSFGINRSLVVGRALDCDLAIVSPQVSRQHARLDLEDDQLYVEDLGSANGTIINGKRVDGRQPLHHDDELRFHDAIFRVTEKLSRVNSERQFMSQTTYIETPADEAAGPEKAD